MKLSRTYRGAKYRNTCRCTASSVAQQQQQETQEKARLYQSQAQFPPPSRQPLAIGEAPPPPRLDDETARADASKQTLEQQLSGRPLCERATGNMRRTWR